MSYFYGDSIPAHTNSYLWPVIASELQKHCLKGGKAFDLGCGNGATANFLSSLSFEVVGIDPSESGIRQANIAFPHIRCERGDAYENLSAKYGQFDLVVALEVIEHCIDPRRFLKTFHSLLSPGGLGIISTPYHGYLKNVALAVSGKMDAHFTALWDGGHIKFFSIATLTQLLCETGFRNVEVKRIGRLPALAKSMMTIVRKAE